MVLYILLVRAGGSRQFPFGEALERVGVRRHGVCNELSLISTYYSCLE